MSGGQTPQTATRTSSSSGLMRGTGTVSSRRSFTPRYTTAFMVFGITNIGPIQIGTAADGYPDEQFVGPDARHRHGFEPQIIHPAIHHRLHGLWNHKHRAHSATVGTGWTEKNSLPWTLDFGLWTLDFRRQTLEI